MTSEEKTAYMLLSQYKSMASRVTELEARVAKARKAAARASPSEGEQISNIEEMYSAALGDLSAKIGQIMLCIDTMCYEQHKRVLELRYIDGRPWATICNRMHLSRSAIHRLHINALKEFYSCYIS